jgi:hypothetical protein
MNANNRSNPTGESTGGLSGALAAQKTKDTRDKWPFQITLPASPK